MRNLIFASSILLASISQARPIQFLSWTDLPEEVQQTIQSAVDQQCPASVKDDWTIVETITDDRRDENSDGIIFLSKFAVDGTDQVGRPQKGALTIETYMIIPDEVVQSKVLSIQGLCR